MKKISLNEFIKVKLTDRGRDIYYHRYDKINAAYPKANITPSFPKVDENGFTEFQLWDFIHIYGSYIHMGAKKVIEGNRIYIDENDLEE